MFAVFNQEDDNRGYLVFYGTLGTKEILESSKSWKAFNSKLFLYYLDNEEAMQSFVINHVTIDGGADQYLSPTYNSNNVNILFRIMRHWESRLYNGVSV